jgi:O-glycosyl hydrolase
MAWWANIIGGWNQSQRLAVAQAMFDPNSGLGLNVLRYNFGADGPTNVCHNQQAAASRTIPSFEPTNGKYVWTNDANQLWMAQEAQALGADVFEGFVNSPPAWMLKNSCTAGGNGGADNLNPSYYSAYASYLATIAQHFHDNFGITLQTVEPFNEPSIGWSSTGTQEGMVASRTTQNTVIPLVKQALVANGASAYSSVSAPDDNQVGEAYNDYQSYSSSTKADLAQWNTHTYGGSSTDRTNAYTNIGQRDGKRIWMSEWGGYSTGSQIGAAMALSNEILYDEQYLHPSAWVIWQAVNEAKDTTPYDDWGLAYRDANNNISYPTRYYAMGNYSKFVREGDIVIGNSDAKSLTAYDPNTHSLIIVTTNSTTSSETVSYNLSAFASVGTTATPHQTSATENLVQLSAMSIANKAFSASLPAQSITTFVIPNVTTTEITPTPTTGITPTPTPGTTPTPTPTVGASTCSVAYAVSSSWSGGFGANVAITNTGTTTINGWTLAWTFPDGQQITQIWNGTSTQVGNKVTVTNVSYNGTIAPNDTVAFGFNGSWNGTNNNPTSFTLNGTVCH